MESKLKDALLTRQMCRQRRHHHLLVFGDKDGLSLALLESKSREDLFSKVITVENSGQVVKRNTWFDRG